MAPNISIRESIRWLPNAASEPTSTLVLTSAENRFVDIRILKPPDTTQNDENSSGNNESSFANTHPNSHKLDWAFAGKSLSSIKDTGDNSGKPVVHSRWRHWVDSRHPDAESVLDEGDMFPQSDGTTLECGSMVNPASGKMERYEEVWTDVEALATGPGDGGRMVCTVLVLSDDGNRARGMVVRVGQFCQGVLRVGERFSLERWAWKEEGGWKREVRIGDLFVPCGVVVEGGEGLKMGGEVEYGDFLWRVVEMSEF